MRSLLYVIILLVAAGCSMSGSSIKELDDAQRLMQSDPGAAMSALNAIDVSELPDSATMARWALLYSEAMVINHLYAPADTIVDIAIDYYGKHHRRDEFQKASHLKALLRSSAHTDTLATALYLQKEKEFLLYKERTHRHMYMCVGLIMILIAGGIIIWMRQRMSIQRLRNEALMAEASGLRSRMAESRNDVGRLEATLRNLLDNRFALIDSLCQTYYESQGTKTERKAIVEKVRSEIDSLRSDSFADMEQVVNDCCGNILVKVRQTFPEIKDSDYRLLVYLASRLSPRAISLLLGESVEVVYKRKSRLKGRLKELVAPVCPGVVELF